MRNVERVQPHRQPRYAIPQPQRVRRIEQSFAWLDHRLLRNGYLAVLTHAEQAFYLFLVLAADRHGVSFYRKEKICDLLGLDFGAFEVARDRLIELQLIAFEPYHAGAPNGHYQILPVDRPAPDLATRTLQALRAEPTAAAQAVEARAAAAYRNRRAATAEAGPASLKTILESMTGRPV